MRKPIGIAFGFSNAGFEAGGPPSGPAGAAGAAGATGATGAAGTNGSGQLNFRAGTDAIANGTSSKTVAFSTAMPDTSYVVMLSFDNNTNGSLSSAFKILDIENKTVNGFDVVVRNAQAAGTVFPVTASLPFAYIAIKTTAPSVITKTIPTVNTYATATQTLTVADLTTNGIARMEGTLAGSLWTTPTAAAIVAGIPGIAVGDSFIFRTCVGPIDTAAAFNILVAGGVGVTLRTGNDGSGLASSGGPIGLTILFRATNVGAATEAFDMYVC